MSNADFPAPGSANGPAAQSTWGLRASVRRRQQLGSAVQKPLRQSSGEDIYG